MRQKELDIIEGTNQTSVSIDKVSRFSIRPPELRYLIDNIGMYYCWFYINPERLNYNQIKNELHNDIFNSSWIDGLCIKVHLQRRSIFGIIIIYKYHFIF